MQTLKLPKRGQAMENGTIVEWCVAEGERVSEHEPVVLFETDKMTGEITADQDGILHKQEVSEGSTVPIGTVLGYVGAPDEAVPNGDTTVDDKEGSGSGPPTDDGGEVPDTVRGSPSARTAAREAGVTVETVGRALGVSTVRTDHVEEYLSTIGTSPDRRIRASPYAMKRAEELGVDIEAVGQAAGTDRVRAAAVEDFAETTATDDTTAEVVDEARSMTDSSMTEPRVAETIPIEGVREVMYDRMSVIATEYCSTTTVARVDVTDLVALRDRLTSAWETAYELTPSYTAFVVAAVARSLPEYRELNAELVDGTELRVYDDINIGVAVNADDGLVVPTVYDADDRSVRGLTAEIDRLAEAVRDGSIDYDALQNGTFTVSNAGQLGAYINTPRINPPQTAILGICTIFDEPGIVDGEVVPRKKLHLCLTYDHRVIEGATAVEFLQSVKTCLETPAQLLS